MAQGECPFKHYPKLTMVLVAVVAGFFALKYFGVM
jgi:hypothetical protein